ncbi:MAG TPA: tRNA (N(6)-L-threonylcarbamoyladenosine(37)-C(2))-methylthiotransferase MtaB [Candidatus Cloacimonas sp.]|jgi:threonylcarbamoyladenosine tRNA methylthiotransferase MtaB|nr:threonylcarbamoyladenosine tRNA methylthiotransferase MtaB [Candidatus Cloacimonadota bacterium]HCX73020.1 tRNA (N(6)-L-threonylcarbamoyladenosine(37)-C(2))-methylthiotransferase MtaB [Candidatus Cloacimonas sp.]
MKTKKVAAITFGCKVNQYETACILDDFIQAGYELQKFSQPADVYIINSCTVTNRTDYKSRNAIRKALKQKQRNSNVKVIVTGCYAQLNKAEIEWLGAVDLVIDNNHKNEILKKLEEQDNSFQDVLEAEYFADLSTSSMIDKTRAFIKVQDGCDYYCAYCTIPFARGHSRSRDAKTVLEQIKKLTCAGYREFVLGGINLGLYGREKLSDYRLAHLLYDIEQISDVKMIRLSSIEPLLFDDELLEFLKKSNKICPHFHIPLQSGSDILLKKMNRHYTTAQFRQKLEVLREIFPDAAFGFDLVVGLPGETEQFFAETYRFLQELDFTYLHLFSYSKRPGTKAAEMKGQVNGRIIKERVNILKELSNKKTALYSKHLLDNQIRMRGIAETEQDGYWTALSDHYMRIYQQKPKLQQGDIIQGNPTQIFRDGLLIQ